MKEKTQTVDSLELFNKGLVIPTGVRWDRLKVDKGTDCTSSAFKQYCRDTAIKLDFASPNTPQQQMSVKEGRLRDHALLARRFGSAPISLGGADAD